MGKFAVFSGFLGSGKTTAMMALTKYHTEHRGKAAMISNDLGDQSLADHKLAVLAGCNASELTGECICYQMENLVARLDALFGRDGCELVISDIPGFGVGALEHVYHTLAQQYPRRYALAPFTVLVEPRTVEMLRSGTGTDLEYILKTQLSEADLIVLSKCDLLDETRRREAEDYLRQSWPQAKVLPISARTGLGMEELSRALAEGLASLHRPDIGYGGEAFRDAMGKISEYYIQYHAAVCCNDFDGNTYLEDLAERIRTGIRQLGQEIPHLKLLAWEPEGDYAKADVLGAEREIQVSHRFTKPCTDLAVMLNGSAVCPADRLEDVITEAVHSVSDRYRLELMIFKKECFGMGG